MSRRIANHVPRASARTLAAALAVVLAATLAVVALPAPSGAAPVLEVTASPQPTSVQAKQTATFRAAATGATSQQWERSTDGGGTWEPVPGATATTLSFTAHGDEDGDQYRAVFTDGAATATTAAAVLGVSRIPVTITTDVEAGTPSPVYPAVFTTAARLDPVPDSGSVSFFVDDSLLGDRDHIPPSGWVQGPEYRNATARSGTFSSRYSGDVDHLPAVSEAVPFTVARAPIGLTLRVEPAAPIRTGDLVTVRYDFDKWVGSGSIEMTLDGAPFGVPTGPGPEGSYRELPPLAPGPHTFSLSYSGGFEYIPVTASVSFWVHTPDQAYVWQLYRAVLEREPDSVGLRYWAGVLGQLKRGLPTGDRFAQQDAARGRLVDDTYREVLGRPADPSGLRQWVGKLAAGTALPGDVRAALFGSDEAYRRAGRDPGALVDQLYAVYLGRASDPSGRAYWADRIGRATTPAARAAVARSGFSRTPGAASTALRQAALDVCGLPPASAPSAGVQAALLDTYRSSGQDPLRLAAATLYRRCPNGPAA